MFDDQLNELKRANSDVWISKIEIEWCNAKLYLYALTFTIPANTDPSHNIQIQIHRQAILHKALEAASNLITELKKLGQLCTSDLYPGGLLSFVPKPYFTALFNATTFLFRFMATCISRTPYQETHAMGLIVEAHKIFQSFPEQRELTRAAIHIEMLMAILRDGPSVNLNELAVNNKLGASIMFDAVFQACRQRNTDPRTGKALPVQEWKTVNETFAQRLPETPAQKMMDHDGNVSGVAGDGIDGFDSISQSVMGTSGGQNPPLWEAWDNYIDLFQVGVEQWGSVDMEQSMDNYDNLGELELGGFMYT
ncbi:hypothetical protein EG329_001545 [Mollisiaceae sp. DMI_Dod_QoI]|nr:hypothetical protein EG329_001545 [Helotiales sp. DMI_Dod_QoI]